MSNIKKYLITVLVSVSCILMMTTNVSAWTRNCNTIEQQVAEVYEEMWSSTGACTLLYEYGLINYASECISLQSQYNEMIEWADTYCNVSCETNLDITRYNWRYKVDGVNQYIFLIRSEDGETLFCIDPTMTIDTCTDYTDSTIRINNETYQKIAIAIKRYSESPTTNHFV